MNLGSWKLARKLHSDTHGQAWYDMMYDVSSHPARFKGKNRKRVSKSSLSLPETPELLLFAPAISSQVAWTLHAVVLDMIQELIHFTLQNLCRRGENPDRGSARK